MDFDGNPAKDEWTRKTRGFGFDYAARIFAGPTIETIDDRRDYGEVRINAIGAVGADVLHVTYTVRGPVRWIISARFASRKERRLWSARP